MPKPAAPRLGEGELDIRQALYDALANSAHPLSLYELMAATDIVGWDAAQELKAMVRDGVCIIARDTATCYRLRVDVAVVRARALEAAISCDDDLWSFCHSMMMEIVESQGGVHQSSAVHGHCDGFYDLPDGEFDVSSAATRLQIALETRAAFLIERSENDKSG